MQAAWIVLVLTAVSFAGCVSPDQTVPNGQAAEPGTVRVQEQANGQFIARRTDSASGAFANGHDVRAITVNGAVTVGVGAGMNFTATAFLWATGASEAEARQRLNDLRLIMGHGADAEVSAIHWDNRGGDLVVRVPVADSGRVEATTTHGVVSIEELAASSVHAVTRNGAIQCEVDARQLDLRTTNGAITCNGKVRDANVTTTNGQIVLDLEPSSTGTWKIGTTNGDISLQVVATESIGYNVTGTTTKGPIEFEFSETETLNSQQTHTGGSRHERTQGFASRMIQTTIALSTGNGAIDAGS